ncbi:right-handed parallel beta-helix repeat-containing protein [Telmatospirillum sp.]|uniref:right-handed parallel beta-helix repeat-containing protein n=1 Tax=Telmatospirillum sp. TaxID=2079197 RepID=UPI002840A2A5|nr:right-handed parallel beta-helix repeat-containing protein [Telmatospirillum sp.]MDR3439934.1 right-handed parallel beta-helix repeat-containing protein [Telmatospirillum sp.]
MFLSPMVVAAQSPSLPQTWDVGPDQPLHVPSDASRVVHDGDTVRIAPGEYFDCAVWSASRLTIEGSGPGVVITDKTCQGKALFITRGQSTTIRNITFTRARVPDGNGAGIRAEGRDLTVEDSTFTNNEVGILGADAPGAEIKIVGSTFIDNGRCRAERCVGSIMFGQVAVLNVGRSHFRGDRGADVIVSSALRTELSDTEIIDNNAQAHLVNIQGAAAVVLERCALEAGPAMKGRSNAAVFLGFSPFDDGQLRFVGNHVTNKSAGPIAFVLNWTSGDVQLEHNVLTGNISETSSSGRWSHWAYYKFRDIKDGMRHIIGSVLRAAHLI